jgi:DNA polymerase delta subunit 1
MEEEEVLEEDKFKGDDDGDLTDDEVEDNDNAVIVDLNIPPQAFVGHISTSTGVRLSMRNTIIDSGLVGKAVRKNPFFNSDINDNDNIKIDEKLWMRPDVPGDAYENESIEFMCMDTTYSSIYGERAIIEVHGVTAQGNSVLVNVYNFLPYFCVIVKNEVNVDEMIECLEEKLTKEMQRNKFFANRAKYVEGWSIVNMKSIFGYWLEIYNMKTIKIMMSDPKLVPNARKYFSEGRLGILYGKIPTYEANIRFDIRFMVDMNIHGCQWVRLTQFQRAHQKRSHAQIELNVYDVYHDEFVPLKTPEIAPFRTLSYDIECITFDGSNRFPDAKTDPIISIGCYCYSFGRQSPDFKCVFALVPSRGDTIDPLPDGICYTFHSESSLIMAFSRFIRIYDPDIITGYNISNFDNR